MNLLHKLKNLFSASGEVSTPNVGSEADWDAVLALDDREQEHFERALKFYFFARQVDRKRCDEELQERLTHAGHVAFSMITGFLEERRFQIEYMEFINAEVPELMQCSEQRLAPLSIKPNEILEMELNDIIRWQFRDEESGKQYRLEYLPEEATVSFRMSSEG